MTQILNKKQKGKTSPNALVDPKSIDGGEGCSEPVEAISQQELLASLDQLNHEFKEYEQIREGIGTRITSLTQLVPRLNERKRLLENDIEENRQGVQQLNHQIPVLHKQKEGFLRSIPQEQEQQKRLEMLITLHQNKVKEITSQIFKLTDKREKTEKIIEQKQDEITKIDEQIKQISRVQECGLDFFTTLVYASKKEGNKKSNKKHLFSNYL